MTTFGTLTKQAQDPSHRNDRSGAVMVLLVDLTARAWASQYAAGAPINDTTAAHFTGGNLSPTRIPQIVLGSGGANPVVFTIVGTDPLGAAQTKTVTAAGAGTYKATAAFATITSFSSNIDPGGTVDLQAGDTMDAYPSRGLLVGTTAGAIAMQLEEDAAVQTVPGIQLGDHSYHVKRINISGTAAVGISLLY